MVSTLN
jgi:hypothetical protein